MLREKLIEELYDRQDLKYKDLQIRLIPSVDPDCIIGVRTPELRALAKRIAGSSNLSSFLNALPHQFFEENQLHAFILSEMKDYSACLKEVDRFLPWINNWATCDQMSPKVFRKHRNELLEPITRWMETNQTYMIRFGIKMLMDHFLDESFEVSFPERVAAIRTDEYYVKMMAAWYFATALAKQYDAVLPFLEHRRLDPWTHNKAIQKALESYRIPEERKSALRNLKLSTARKGS